MLACPAALMAQSAQEWALVEPQSGSRVLMSNVSFLLAADEDDSFSVVCKDGTVIYGAKKVTFELTDPSGIAMPSAEGNGETPTLCGSIDGRLRLTGCAEGTEIKIYDAGGRKMSSTRVATDETVVNVGGLPTGIYVLRAGKTAIKFMKK